MFADDWIRTADLWRRKRPLYQLRHTTALKIFSVNYTLHYFLAIWLDAQSFQPIKTLKINIAQIWLR